MITRINGHREPKTNFDGVIVKITARGAIGSYEEMRAIQDKVGGFVYPCDALDLDCEWLYTNEQSSEFTPFFS